VLCRTIGSDEVEKVWLEEFLKYGYTETKAVQLVHRAVERGATDILMPIDWALRQIEEDWVDIVNNPNISSFADQSSARHLIEQLGFSKSVAIQYVERIYDSAAPFHLNIPEWAIKLLEADWLISCQRCSVILYLLPYTHTLKAIPQLCPGKQVIQQSSVTQ
jgi:hypothetical protein